MRVIGCSGTGTRNGLGLHEDSVVPLPTLRMQVRRINPLRWRNILSDDLPRRAHLTHRTHRTPRTVVLRGIRKLEMRRADDFSLRARLHGRIEGTADPKCPFDGVRGLARDEVVLDRVAECLEEVAVVPRAAVEVRGEWLGLAFYPTCEVGARVAPARFSEYDALDAVLIGDECTGGLVCIFVRVGDEWIEFLSGLRFHGGLARLLWRLRQRRG